jgi:hypothetical protein
VFISEIRVLFFGVNTGLFSKFLSDINAKNAGAKDTETEGHLEVASRSGPFEAVGKIIQAVIFRLAHFFKARLITSKIAGAVHRSHDFFYFVFLTVCQIHFPPLANGCKNTPIYTNML